MSGRNKKSKVSIHMSKPDLPPFLQRMKEQIVANEEAERKEQSQRKRKDRPGRSDDPDDDPTIVKIGDDDLTEEEYKRMKTELETQYKLDNDRINTKPVELDVDDLIQKRQDNSDLKAAEKTQQFKIRPEQSGRSHESVKSRQKAASKDVGKNKKLSYGSSSEDED